MTAREAALMSLGEFRRNKRAGYARDLLQTRPGIAPCDRALAMRIFLGVLQNMMLCDYYAAQFSSMDLRKIEHRVLDILRLSIYQIVFLSKIPHSAAVNEGVALTKRYANPRAAGYVNAILRNISNAAQHSSLPEITGDPIRRLSVGYSHPEWLVRELSSFLSQSDTESFLAACNDADTSVTAQVNTLLTDTDTALRALHAENIEAKAHASLEGCIEIVDSSGIMRSKAFNKGYIYIQDVSSRFAVVAASPGPGDSVLDGCAAPGGKSFAAAIAMKGTGRIIACDRNAAKLQKIKDGCKRLGIDIITTCERDSSTERDEADSNLHGEYDAVLADVPCSGFGVIRKKPDIRYKSISDIEGLPKIQKDILYGTSTFVKPGGVLVYSTCTVFRQENEDVIEWFLNKNSGFSTEGFSLPGIGQIPDGYITLWPHIHGTDGFFICKLRRQL